MKNKKEDAWCETGFKLSNGIEFTICHNIPDYITAALDNWLARTKEYTAESFCNYINKKRLEGKSDHFAYTVAEFEEFNGVSIDKLRREERK